MVDLGFGSWYYFQSSKFSYKKFAKLQKWKFRILDHAMPIFINRISKLEFMTWSNIRSGDSKL